ncbi:MAG: PTS sugar transporter subunit IIA [Candidatus Cloacimonadota bacterium]|nr:MAG: PTS sugar transporter subunit IIA [Candidatus Cloacimonadota bacterium]
MLLSDYVKADTIIAEFTGADKQSTIKEMVNLLASSGDITESEQFLEGIMEREDIESTAIGNGIAIPHARGPYSKNLAISIGKSKQGIDFNALDGNPVHLVFMIAAPTEAKKEYLQVIAKIARFLKNEANRKIIVDAETKEQILQVIGDFDASYPGVETVKTKDGRVIHKEME